MKTKFTFDLKTILIVGVIFVVLLGGGFGFLGMKLDDTNDKLAEQINLSNAIQDTLSYTRNKLDEEVATKLTLQATLKELNNQNEHLSNNQKELLNRIENLKYKNDLISAALVETQIKIDSLRETIKGKVNKEDSSVSFAQTSDSLSFDFTVRKVIPAPEHAIPTLHINNLTIPNKQFIEFRFADNKEHYQTPIEFSISNSNPLVKTVGADSYTIPEVNPDIKPTFWEKVDNFFNKPTVKIIGGAILFSGGVYVGATL